MLVKLRELLQNSKLWMEGFAQKPQALLILFIISFAESSFFPLPPDILLVAIAVASPKTALKAALICTIGSVLGGMFGYYLGYSLMATIGNSLIEFYHGQEAWQVVVDGYNSEKGIWFLGGAAFTPIPYKVATLAAGATKMDLTMFTIVSFLGRGARFFLVATFIYILGPKVKVYIDKYFELITMGLLFLLIIGFVVIKYVFTK